jgi:hypothetical protein
MKDSMLFFPFWYLFPLLSLFLCVPLWEEWEFFERKPSYVRGFFILITYFRLPFPP